MLACAGLVIAVTVAVIVTVTGRDDDGHLLVTKLFEIYGPPDLPESEEPKKKKRVPKPTRANNALKEANLPSGSTETLSIEELFEAGKGLHYSSPYVGTWVERSLAESASAIITTTLSPNGTFTAKAVLRSLEKGDCTTVRVRTSGRWIVDGQDVLLLVDETSEPDVIPVGFVQIHAGSKADGSDWSYTDSAGNTRLARKTGS